VKARIDDAFPTLEQVIAAGEAVESLLAHPGWDLLQGIVQAEIDSALTALDRGGTELPSQAEYARAHGRRGGLLYLREVAQATVARAAQRYEEQRFKHEGAAETAPEGAAA
jgi:hypothetical protein